MSNERVMAIGLQLGYLPKINKKNIKYEMKKNQSSEAIVLTNHNKSYCGAFEDSWEFEGA